MFFFLLILFLTFTFFCKLKKNNSWNISSQRIISCVNQQTVKNLAGLEVNSINFMDLYHYILYIYRPGSLDFLVFPPTTLHPKWTFPLININVILFFFFLYFYVYTIFNLDSKTGFTLFLIKKKNNKNK